MLLPFKSLVVFEAVTRHGSFTKAALELNVTQSAISHQIKNLEAYFSVALLVRQGSMVQLTREGEVLYKDLSKALALMKRGVGNLKAQTSLEPIGISVRSHFALKWLSPRLRKAKFNYEFRFYHRDDSVDFSDSRLHLSIEWLRRDNLPEGAQLLVPGNLTPACHPSLLKDYPVPSDPLILQHFALLHETQGGTWQDWLAQAGVPDLKPQRNEYYSDTNVRQQAAIEKLGFALVCPDLIADDLREGRLICPFEHKLQDLDYYLVVPEDRLALPNVRHFVHWLTQEVKNSF